MNRTGIKGSAGKTIRIRPVLTFIAGLLIFSFLVYLGGTRGIEKNLHPEVTPLVFCFIAHFLVLLIGSLRWGYLIDTMMQEKVCSSFEYFFYFVGGAFTGQYISKLGGDFLVRPGLLKKKENIPYKKGVMAVFIEKTIDMLLIFILLIPAGLYFLKVLSARTTMIVTLLLPFIVFFFFIFKNSRVISLLKRISFSLLTMIGKIPLLNRFAKASYFEKLEKLDAFSLFRKKSLLYLFSLTLLRYFLLILRLYFLTSALKLGIPIIVIILGIPVAQTSLLFSFTPGALGVLEGGWYVVLSLAGVLRENISTFLIGQRIYWTLFIGIIFFIVYVCFGIMKHLNPGEKTDPG